MDKFELEAIWNFSAPRFQAWKEFLSPQEQAVFTLYYHDGFSIIQISQYIHYSETHVKRILKSARKKIYKHCP